MEESEGGKKKPKGKKKKAKAKLAAKHSPPPHPLSTTPKGSIGVATSMGSWGAGSGVAQRAMGERLIDAQLWGIGMRRWSRGICTQC